MKSSTTVELQIMSTNYSHAIILDFEATCDNQSRPLPQEIIEFPSVLLSLDTHEIIDEFESFVKPAHHPVLSEFCTTLTSIRQSDVDNAAVFPDVLQDHATWLNGHDLDENNSLFVTCGDWDLGTMLPAQCAVAQPPVEALAPVYTRWQNIKHAYCRITGKAKAPGMSGMLRELGLELVGHHHRGIDDCRNIAALLKTLFGRGARVEITARLPVSKYPPITVLLCLGEQVEQARLDARSIKILLGLSGRLFRCKPVKIQRQDGRLINDDEDLASLCPGERLRLTPP